MTDVTAGALRRDAEIIMLASMAHGLNYLFPPMLPLLFGGKARRPALRANASAAE